MEIYRFPQKAGVFKVVLPCMLVIYCTAQYN